MHFTHYNDDCYIEYVTRVNGPDDKRHDNVEQLRVIEIRRLCFLNLRINNCQVGRQFISGSRGMIGTVKVPINELQVI